MNAVKLNILAGNELYPTKRVIDAYPIGAWAFHESQNGEGWGVTDIRSGRAIPPALANGMSREEAEAVAVHLDARLGAAPEVICRCSDKVEPWPYVFDALIAEALEGEAR